MRVRFGVFGLAAGLAAAGFSHAAQAQAAGGGYGGGFIEYLMTGAGPVPAPRAPGRSRQAGLAQQASPGGYAGTARYPMGNPYAGDPPDADLPQGRVRLAALPAPADQGGGGYEGIGRALDPRYERQVVPFEGRQGPGSIVIDTGARYLYLVQPGGRAIRYGIGVGRPGFLWKGSKTISQKREWPDWTPPSEMLARRPDLPRHMDGGPENPLGARAMYLGSSLYRIHGTNEPHTIGQAVSSGCIRMMNEDVIDLYARTPVGTRVEVL